MQLVNDCVIMYDTMKDKKIGIAEVIEKFGVPPDKVIEVQSLIGDFTDNVPGVPGIGVKTAAQLIGEYGDLETLLARAGEIKQEKRRQSLIENAELARLSKKLVTLDDKVKLDVPLADLAVHDPDYRRLIAFLKAMEFDTLTRRVAEFSGVEAGEIEADEKLKAGGRGRQLPRLRTRAKRAGGGLAKPDARARRPFPAGGGAAQRAPAMCAKRRRRRAGSATFTPQALAAARAEARAAQGRSLALRDRAHARAAQGMDCARARLGMVAIDTETTSLDPMQATLCGFSLALAPNEACYVPLAHRQGGERRWRPVRGRLAPDQIPESAALAAIKPLLEDPSVLKVGQNLKFDWQIFALRGIEIAPCDDTMLMSYVLDAGRSDHGLDPLVAALFRSRDDRFQRDDAGSARSQDDVRLRRRSSKAAEYAAEDADVTLRLWQVLKPRLIAEHVDTVYETLERPLVPVLARMERRGISIDRQVLSRLSGEFAQRAAGLEAEIQKLAGEPLNPGSPKQLGDILFGKMGLPGGTRTKTGQWSTGARALEELAEQGHALPQKILDWRQVSKLRSTYTDALPGYVNPDRTACTPATRSRLPPPGGSRPRSPTCRTSRSAPRKAARSGAPLSRRRASSSRRPTIRRSSCGFSLRSPTSRR